MDQRIQGTQCCALLWPVGHAQEVLHAAQALQVVEFLLKKGSGLCVDLAKEDLRHYIEQLQTFEHSLPSGRDCGVNVRVRCAPPHLLQTVGASARCCLLAPPPWLQPLPL
jgi:hypothetical protein